MKNVLLLFVFALALFACEKAPQPIDYGEDDCDFCSMTIVSPSHAAQVVTKKGINYKFDASECMINFLNSEMKEEDMLYVLSADYLNPGELINSKDATFLVSENIPSPMGAFLSAVNTKEAAQSLQKENDGELFTWDEIKKKIGSR